MTFLKSGKLARLAVLLSGGEAEENHENQETNNNNNNKPKHSSIVCRSCPPVWELWSRSELPDRVTAGTVEHALILPFYRYLILVVYDERWRLQQRPIAA